MLEEKNEEDNELEGVSETESTVVEHDDRAEKNRVKKFLIFSFAMCILVILLAYSIKFGL